MHLMLRFVAATDGEIGRQLFYDVHLVKVEVLDVERKSMENSE